MSRPPRDSGAHPDRQAGDPPTSPAPYRGSRQGIRRPRRGPDRSLEGGPVTAAPEPAAALATVHVVCAAAGISLAVPPGVSVLECVRAAGLEVPAPCADGRCGECETRVLEGTPEHRDGVLTAEERAFGETMMICVSRSVTPQLVLDL
nr:2Fe-2S iron-sulfur cluster binding domain-containing protein [Modestobacter versicolor]